MFDHSDRCFTDVEGEGGDDIFGGDGGGDAGGEVTPPAPEKKDESASDASSSDSSDTDSSDISKALDSDEDAAKEKDDADDIVPAEPEDRLRGKAECAFRRPDGGLLSVYTAADGTRSLVATCPVHGTRCRKTLGLQAARTRGRRGQGRPLGMMLLWLDCASHPALDKEKHNKCFQKFKGDPPLLPKPTKAERREARQHFRTLEGGIEFEVDIEERIEWDSETCSEPTDIPL